jgi:DNA uptake protein ComE-like DNA-binding protein
MVDSYRLRARLARTALVSFLLFPPSGGTVSAAQTPSKPAPQQTIAEKIAASKDLLDINTATADQLKALPGMGDAYMRRVVAGRPYTAKNQLTTRGILPTADYERIRELIIAHRPKTQ